MQLHINYDKKTGDIVSYQQGPNDAGHDDNDCPDYCETITVDPAIVKFDPDRMKVAGGQLVLKKG